MIGNALVALFLFLSGEAMPSEALPAGLEKVSKLPIRGEDIGPVALDLATTGRIQYGGFQYQDTASGEMILFTIGCSSGTFQQLWVARLDPWKAERIIQVDSTSFADRLRQSSIDSYRISPNGKYVAFTVRHGLGGDLYLDELQSGEPRQLTYSPDTLEYDVEWIGNNTHLLYARTQDQDGELQKTYWARSLDDTNEELVCSLKNVFPNSYDTSNPGEVSILDWQETSDTEKSRIQHPLVTISVENGKVATKSLNDVPNTNTPKGFYAYTVQNEDSSADATFSSSGQPLRIVRGEVLLSADDKRTSLFKEEGVGRVIGWPRGKNKVYFTWIRKGESGFDETNIYRVNVE